MPQDLADMTDDELQAHLRDLRDVTARAPVETPLPKVTVEILPWGHAPDRYVPDLAEVPPDPADPWPPARRPGHLSISSESGKVTVSAAVWDMAAIDALMAEHKARFIPPPLAKDDARARLLFMHRRFVEEHLHRLTGAGSPADDAPPLTGKQARAMIADDLPPRHGKSLLWAGLLDELERAKEPPELPPSPVVQAALVVDPEE